MFVPVHPPSPSTALTAALIAAGCQPVPFEGLDELEAHRPKGGWGPAVVEVREDAGASAAIAAKVRGELGLTVLLVVDRTSTEMLTDVDEYDDFLLSPIDRTELEIRIGRLGGIDVEDGGVDADVIRFEDLELNTATYQAALGGSPRDLTYMEYELLRFFVEHRGRVWSREQILSKVWGYDYFGGSRTVDVHVRRLRAKLGEERASWITTVRSVGYRFG
jgi:DNA-binding response OmpR family regulator